MTTDAAMAKENVLFGFVKDGFELFKTAFNTAFLVLFPTYATLALTMLK